MISPPETTTKNKNKPATNLSPTKWTSKDKVYQAPIKMMMLKTKIHLIQNKRKKNTEIHDNNKTKMTTIRIMRMIPKIVHLKTEVKNKKRTKMKKARITLKRWKRRKRAKKKMKKNSKRKIRLK